MDRFAYAIPIVCVLPFSLILTLTMCEAQRNDPCYFATILPDSVFFNCSYDSVIDGLLRQRLAWVFVFWFASYLWLVMHIFTQKPRRLSRTDTYVLLGFCFCFICFVEDYS
jgi:hypothetical protein